MKKTTWNALRGLALAGALGAMSAGQSAKAVFIFDVVDASTYTLTLSGSSLNAVSPGTYQWGAITGSSTHDHGITGLPGADLGEIWHSGGTMTGLRLTGEFGDTNQGPLADGGVITVPVAGLDLTTLTLPAAPLAMVPGTATGTNNSLTFTAVPEPSSTAILALGGCAMLLRRRRA